MASSTARMRAVLIEEGKGPAENLYIGQTAKPLPKETEIKAFGLNRMDISQREGNYPPPPGASSILGVEFSGTVDEVGSGVCGWKVGDEVMGLAGGGAYAEYIVVQSTNIISKPAHLSWVEAASIPENFLTAFQAIVQLGEIKSGENVLVHAGASGVGVAAIQLARIHGAKTVTATASTPAKLDWLSQMPNGATHTANYKTQNFADVVKVATDGSGVDVLVDFVGRSHWERNIESLGVDGRMIILSFLSGNVVDRVDLAPVLRKRLRIQGSTLRSRSIAYQADLIERFRKDALENITGSEGDGPLRTYIYKVYEWNEIREAHREMEANKNSGKIVCEVT